jgi:D-alanyl-D-alanine carboxypeptidase (penicillin-binding protein 5/6)
MTTIPVRPHVRRIIVSLLASCAVVGALAVAPGTAPAAASAPVGGPMMGINGTARAAGTARLPASVTARSFVVADLTTGAVYAVRRPHQKRLPASTLKTLTALTLLRNVPLDKRVKMGPNVRGAECSCVGLQKGRTYRVNDLLHALLMRSGNDVAELLATATGSRSRTLTLMNRTARDLRALDTHAATPSGLDGRGQSMSAYDLALINRAAFRDPRFVKLISTRYHRFGPIGGAQRKLENQNELWHLGYRGQIGSKNGWTTASKQTFVGVARRGDRTLLVAVLGADRGIAKQTTALLDWGFAVGPGVKPIGTLVEPRARR